MIEFGKTLKDAREAAGLTVAQIAQSTHMMSAMIEDLERENFTRIVAPIYGRGFVKLYCEAVGLDPKPMIAEFMDIYTGKRDPAIHERRVAPIAPEPPPQPPIEPAPEPAPEPEIEEPMAEPPPAPSGYDLFSAPPPPEPTPPTSTPSPKFTRYSAPLRDYVPELEKLNEMKTTIIRWAILVGAAVLVLWLLIVGVRALYRATAPAQEPSRNANLEIFEEGNPPASTSEQPAPTDREPLPNVQPPRTPLAIPPLYID